MKFVGRSCLKGGVKYSSVFKHLNIDKFAGKQLPFENFIHMRSSSSKSKDYTDKLNKWFKEGKRNSGQHKVNVKISKAKPQCPECEGTKYKVKPLYRKCQEISKSKNPDIVLQIPKQHNELECQKTKKGCEAPKPKCPPTLMKTAQLKCKEPKKVCGTKTGESGCPEPKNKCETNKPEPFVFQKSSFGFKRKPMRDCYPPYPWEPNHKAFKDQLKPKY